MKLGLLSHSFTGWGGGIDFIRYIASSISSATDDHAPEKHALILPSDEKLAPMRSNLHFAWARISQLPMGRLNRHKPASIFSDSYLKETFSEFCSHFEITGGGSTLESQLVAAQQAFADVVLPCFEPPDSRFPLPWVGYLYDFQHKHLPELFSENEITIRNQCFSKMLNTATHIIVNSESVSKDAEIFFGKTKAAIHSLPFSPCPQKSWLSSELDVRYKYNINKSFFMVCNQFWKHKDHSTAFRAFAYFLNGNNDAELICTGQTCDDRFPSYFISLKQLLFDLNISSRVRILGHIPKAEQISLLKNSLGLIQPTLFEGGPGGGASYDAISLGIPVIASDIVVNREMNCGDITYFRAGDADSLADAFRGRGTKFYPRPSAAHLWEQGLSRRKHCGKFILKVAELASQS